MSSRKLKTRYQRRRIEIKPNESGVTFRVREGLWPRAKFVPLTTGILAKLVDGQHVVVEEMKLGKYRGVVSWAGVKVGPPYSESVEVVMDDISRKVRRVVRGRLPDSGSKTRFNRSRSKFDVVESLRESNDGATLVYQDAVLKGPDGSTYENDYWLTLPTIV